MADYRPRYTLNSYAPPQEMFGAWNPFSKRISCVYHTASSARREIGHTYNRMDAARGWKDAYRKGWRIVRVTVRPEIFYG
ncbi:hypothetical protein [Euryhalocaulis caribicus]|uniref:hypothetical protein n=1 Tax=Euryhalocaulis caribicus TaxID=1161401 RepID=UPI0003A44482|nr:hypothetical protein [Euryhalocaulis caribicus]